MTIKCSAIFTRNYRRRDESINKASSLISTMLLDWMAADPSKTPLKDPLPNPSNNQPTVKAPKC